MKILGIESSCDDTSISIVDSEKNIIVNEVVSQDVLYIDKLFKKILIKSGLKIKDIDLISATVGPGLIGGLLVGLSFAKTLAQVNNIPFIGVNHLEGHAMTPRLTNNVDFPFLLLLVSGGHSNFYFVLGVNEYIFLGGTLDDALGEAFDKIANILGLGFPGGAFLEKLALAGDYRKVSLPRPLINNKNLDMSFSGLKTAVLNKVKKQTRDDKLTYADLAAGFQKAVSEILCKKISLAIDISERNHAAFINVVVSGGVAANEYLRKNIETLVTNKGKKIFFPPTNLCTDNGAMIAWAGYELYKKGLKSNLKVKAKPRWPLENMGDRI